MNRILAFAICCCTPEISLHFCLACCYAIIEGLVPLPPARPAVGAAVVVIYGLWGVLHLIEKLRDKPPSGGSTPKSGV